MEISNQPNKEIKEPRDIALLMSLIEELIPETEIELCIKIRKFVRDLEYYPFEERTGPHCWSKLGEILNYFIPDITEDWQIKIRDIVNYNY